MFEKPQKAQVVRIKIEAVSLDSTSMAPSLDGPLLGRLPRYAKVRFARSWLTATGAKRPTTCGPADSTSVARRANFSLEVME